MEPGRRGRHRAGVNSDTALLRFVRGRKAGKLCFAGMRQAEAQSIFCAATEQRLRTTQEDKDSALKDELALLDGLLVKLCVAVMIRWGRKGVYRGLLCSVC